MRAEILGLLAGILLVGCSKEDNAESPEQDCKGMVAGLENLTSLKREVVIN